MLSKISVLCYHKGMEKVALRKSIITHLKYQDRKEKALKDKALLDDLLASSAYQKADTIATYLAFDFEYKVLVLTQMVFELDMELAIMTGT